MPVGVFPQLQQKVAHLTGGLPQALLLLPALPAVQSCRAQADDNQHRRQHFDERIALLFFHGGSMTRRKIKTRGEFSVFGALRGKFNALQRVAKFQEPAPKNQLQG